MQAVFRNRIELDSFCKDHLHRDDRRVEIETFSFTDHCDLYRRTREMVAAIYRNPVCTHLMIGNSDNFYNLGNIDADLIEEVAVTLHPFLSRHRSTYSCNLGNLFGAIPDASWWGQRAPGSAFRESYFQNCVYPHATPGFFDISSAIF